MDEILDGRGVGVIVDAFGERGYERAAKRIRELAADPDARARCRAVAREVFSLEEVGIPRYDRLYRRLAATAGGPDRGRRDEGRLRAL